MNIVINMIKEGWGARPLFMATKINGSYSINIKIKWRMEESIEQSAQANQDSINLAR
jgi:hypothetical protein